MCDPLRKWLALSAPARTHDVMPSLVRIVSPTKNPLPLVISKVGALLAVTVACKVHRLVIGYAHTTVGGKVASVALDFSFLLSYAAVWLWILLQPRLGRFLRRSVPCRHDRLDCLCSLRSGFFLSTGATLDWNIVKYAVVHIGELYSAAHPRRTQVRAHHYFHYRVCASAESCWQPTLAGQSEDSRADPSGRSSSPIPRHAHLRCLTGTNRNHSLCSPRLTLRIWLLTTCTYVWG